MKWIATPCWLWLAALPLLHAQHQHEPAADGVVALDHGASGTSANPASSPAEMIHLRAGSWNFALQFVAFLVEEQQSGPRGADKLFPANWLMGVAQHRAGKGTVQFRSMLSLDPATVTNRRYTLLFQTGEAAFGKPIVDGQYPHDFFMLGAFRKHLRACCAGGRGGSGRREAAEGAIPFVRR